MNRGHASRYREADILTMSPGRRLVAVYTKLLSALKQGLAETHAGRTEERVARLTKAHEILEELLYTLDHEQGGLIAANLSHLYEFFMAEVLECSRAPDANRLEGIIACVAELHEAWSQAAEQVEQGEPLAAVAGR